MSPSSLSYHSDNLYNNSRSTLLYIFGSAIHWLFLGALLASIASIKLVFPGFLNGPSFLTYGRIFPAARDLLVYGWAIPAGLGIVTWLTIKLNQSPLAYTKVLTMAAHFWNIGICLGTLAILAGYSTSVEWLEYPSWASFILFVSFLLIAVWLIMAIGSEPLSQLAISHWYFLAAICGFPWIYASANMLLTWGKIQGCAQAPVGCWYQVSLISFLLTFMALGIIYYILPLLLQRSSSKYYSYHLAQLGIWGLLFLTGWSSMRPMIGGPIPAWMVSTSVVATFLLIVPVLANILNYRSILEGEQHHLFDENKSFSSPGVYLPFFVTAILAYLIWTAMLLLEAIPSVNPLFHFTSYTTSTYLLAILGFFSMAASGSIYLALKDLLPHLFEVTLGQEQSNCSIPFTPFFCQNHSLVLLIKRHFWWAFIGVSSMVFVMALGGMLEGIALQDPAISFINILSYAFPWHFMTALSWLLQLVGYSYFGIFFLHMIVMNRFFSLTKSKSKAKEI